MPKKPKRANLRGPGCCIFCGAFGLTHEHLWADWMKEFLPRTQQYHIARKADVGAFTDERVELHRRTGDLYSRRVYCVCKPCNTGWMSQMQEKAKPYLVPMLRRQPIVHHRRAQTVLSAWVTMMTMVAEHVYRDKIAIPQCDRDFLRAHRKPPKHSPLDIHHIIIKYSSIDTPKLEIGMGKIDVGVGEDFPIEDDGLKAGRKAGVGRRTLRAPPESREERDGAACRMARPQARVPGRCPQQFPRAFRRSSVRYASRRSLRVLIAVALLALAIAILPHVFLFVALVLAVVFFVAHRGGFYHYHRTMPDYRHDAES
jgi:hypothetical protein